MTSALPDLGAAELRTLLDASSAALNASLDVGDLSPSTEASALSSAQCFEGAGERVKGKVVVVTGAASGFGKAYALKMSEFGAKLALGDLNLESLELVVKEITDAGGVATAVRCNVTSWDDQVALFQHAVNTYGVVDIVVPNAGVPETGGWLFPTKDSTGKLKKPNLTTIDVNIIGVLYTVKLGLYYLQDNPSKGLKSLVLLGSMSSFFGIPAAALYSASKHAMLGLFRTIYHDGVIDGVNVNIVCPWFVHTPILETPARLLIAGLPLATVPKVVEAIVYASASGTTGNALCVDAKGVIKIPYQSVGGGPGGYYQVFSDRAVGAISLIGTVRDVVKALARGTSQIPPVAVAALAGAVGVVIFRISV